MAWFRCNDILVLSAQEIMSHERRTTQNKPYCATVALANAADFRLMTAFADLITRRIFVFIMDIPGKEIT
jgi:hypothetical protein